MAAPILLFGTTAGQRRLETELLLCQPEQGPAIPAAVVLDRKEIQDHTTLIGQALTEVVQQIAVAEPRDIRQGLPMPTAAAMARAVVLVADLIPAIAQDQAQAGHLATGRTAQAGLRRDHTALRAGVQDPVVEVIHHQGLRRHEVAVPALPEVRQAEALAGETKKTRS